MFVLQQNDELIQYALLLAILYALFQGLKVLPSSTAHMSTLVSSNETMFCQEIQPASVGGAITLLLNIVYRRLARFFVNAITTIPIE